MLIFLCVGSESWNKLQDVVQTMADIKENTNIDRLMTPFFILFVISKDKYRIKLLFL